MTRVVSVGRPKSLLVAGGLAVAFLTVTLAGCPGSLDPSQFPTGAAGTTGSAGAGTAGTGAAGTTGSAGTSGTAGTTGAAGTGSVQSCDITPFFAPTKYACTVAGACHDGSATTAGGLSMQKADWPKLVGSTSKGTNNSMCGANKTPYIIKGSSSGDGLIMQKLGDIPPCGAMMPSIGGPVSSADMNCFKQWATALANQ